MCQSKLDGICTLATALPVEIAAGNCDLRCPLFRLS